MYRFIFESVRKDRERSLIMKKALITLLIASLLIALPGYSVYAAKASDGKSDKKEEAAVEEAEDEESPEDEEAESGEITWEGEGFDTPEEAVTEYIIGLIDWDIEEILSACAIETGVDNYDFEKQIGRTGRMLSPLNGGRQSGYIPCADDFGRQLNVEIRRSQFIQTIIAQYLYMTKSEFLTGRSPAVVELLDYDSVSEMVEEYTVEEGPDILYKGMILPAAFLSDKYYSQKIQYNLMGSAYADGAQQLAALGAVVFVNDEPFLMTFGVEKYDGKWFVTQNNLLSSLLVLNPSGGVCSLTDIADLTAKDVEKMYEEYISDGRLIELTQGIDEKIGETLPEDIFSLPEEEREDAFNKVYLEVTKSVSGDDLKYLEEVCSVVSGMY